MSQHIITPPKTIDNDVSGTDSAREVGTSFGD